jgi:hypothetical protein
MTPKGTPPMSPSPDSLPAVLAAIAGALLSLLAGLTPAYNRLPGAHKRLVMAGLLALAALAVYALACLGNQVSLGTPGTPAVSCDQPGLLSLIEAFLAALTANQATFLISAKSNQQSNHR